MPASLAAPPRLAGRLAVAPEWAEFLNEAGVHDADTVMNLSGEVVSGHADRHVRRVVLTGHDGRHAFYLKREHTAAVWARLKNWLAGAGWVSRCGREVLVLSALAGRGLPGPRPVAWGSDGAGRAFLLVAELAGFAELRGLLAPGRLTARERRRLARRVGESVAELHAAGFPTPDLAAKHVYVNDAGEVALLDWQTSRPGGEKVSLGNAIRPIAGLDASLAAALATPRERLLFVGHYLRSRGVPDLAGIARLVAAGSAKRGRRSSVRDQRGGESARLVWLAGEAACAAAEFAADWPDPADGAPFYPGPGRARAEEVVAFAGRRVRVVRFAGREPIGRIVARLRERPWRSPGAEAGRILVHLARHGVPGPTLVGFGQKLHPLAAADSFVAYLDEPSESVGVVSRQSGAWAARLVRESGVALRRIHDAGLRLTEYPTFLVAGGAVRVASPLSVRRRKRLSPRAASADLARLLAGELAGLDADAIRRAYDGGES